MKTCITCFLFLFISTGICAQDLDLIVTTGGDSIACKIDSVNSDLIYFNTLRDNVKINTSIESEEVSYYEYTAINKNEIIRLPGSIFFRTSVGNLKAQKKNAVYITNGYFMRDGYLGVSILLSYSRFLWEKNDVSMNSCWLSINYGGIEVVEFTHEFISMDFIYLAGRDKNLFELSAGLAARYNPSNEEFGEPIWEGIGPIVRIGYRLQKPGRSFFFRTGIGFPEGLYFGIGFRL